MLCYIKHVNTLETISPVPTSNKELILNKAGATRERGAIVIAEAMVANKMTVDKYGEEHIEPDHAMRLRGEELRARETGDIKPEGSVVNTQVNITCSSAEIKELMEFVNSRRVRDNTRTQTGEIIDVGKYKK